MFTNKVRIYFIRSANRRRILATFAVKCIEFNRLAIAIAVANPVDHSPSRSEGRKYALERLDFVLAQWKAGFKTLPRMDRVKGTEGFAVGGVCELNEIVPFMTRLTFDNVPPATPKWLLKQEPFALDSLYEYTDLFCKIRGDVEKASTQQ